jgi:hypothetical protein
VGKGVLVAIAALALAGCGREPDPPPAVKPPPPQVVQTAVEKVDCSKYFEFDREARVPPSYLVAFIDRQSSETGGGAARDGLVYQPFDYEGGVGDGRRKAMGIVYSSDKKVGGMVWADRSVSTYSNGGGRFERKVDGVYLTVVAESVRLPGGETAPCRGGMVVKLDHEGRLFANGVLVDEAK